MSFSDSMKPALVLIFTICLISLAVAVWLIKWVMAKDTGTRKCARFRRHQKRRRGVFKAAERDDRNARRGPGRHHLHSLCLRAQSDSYDPASPMVLAVCTTVSFLIGAACSVVSGYIGMWVSIRSNIRTASAARTSLNDALRIALRGGAVSGFSSCLFRFWASAGSLSHSS